MPRNYTINFKGEKQVAIKTAGYEKLHVTVMVRITANDNKLLPYIMLNRKTVPTKIFAKM